VAHATLIGDASMRLQSRHPSCVRSFATPKACSALFCHVLPLQCSVLCALRDASSAELIHNSESGHREMWRLHGHARGTLWYARLVAWLLLLLLVSLHHEHTAPTAAQLTE
jgi:hypothetical protein